jgi:MFS family permease
MTAGRLVEMRRSWRTLLGATLGSSVGVHALPFYTSGIFLVALQADMGWGRSAISLGISLFALGLGIAAPVIGALCDRFGELRIIVGGLIVQIGALVALSMMQTIPAFYMLMGGMALFGAGCASLPYTRLINRTFDASKGTALGLMITGTASVSAIAPIMIQAIIADHGWRTGYLALAAAVVVMAPVALLLLRPATSASARPKSDAAAKLRYRDLAHDRTFLLLLVAILLVALAVPGIIAHLPAMLADDGVSPGAAALLIGLVGVTQTIARLGTGLLVDRFFAPRVAALIFSLAAIGFAIFAALGAPLAALGAVAAGLAYGAESDLLGYFVGRYFRQEHFGRVFGLLYAAFLAGNAISPLWYGWSAEELAGYHIALSGAAAALALGALAFLLLPPFPVSSDAARRTGDKGLSASH